jgi:hypothetical protein
MSSFSMESVVDTHDLNHNNSKVQYLSDRSIAICSWKEFILNFRDYLQDWPIHEISERTKVEPDQKGKPTS